MTTIFQRHINNQQEDVSEASGIALMLGGRHKVESLAAVLGW